MSVGQIHSNAAGGSITLKDFSSYAVTERKCGKIMGSSKLQYNAAGGSITPKRLQ